MEFRKYDNNDSDDTRQIMILYYLKFNRTIVSDFNTVHGAAPVYVTQVVSNFLVLVISS